MADKDTLNLIKFKFGSFQSIKDLSSKEQSSFYFADDKPTFYNAGLWYGVSSLTSSVNEETGEVTLTINGDLGEDWKGSQPVCTFVAGMTTEQKDNLKMVVDFVNSITTTEGEDTQTVIDKWNEIINFLEGFKDTDVLLDRIVTLETNVTNLQNTTINAGDGLKGGGNLTGNRTIALGTPSTITDSSTNSVTTDSHTHAIDEASTEQRGIVRLNDSLTSTSTDQALTANQGKVLDGKVKGVADLLNDMFEKVTDNGKTYIKTKYGFASDKFVSAGGTDDTESGGSGGVNLTQMWESLQDNNDTFKDRLINVAHIPTLTTGKISDFVSATQAIADTAVANKADKDKTLNWLGDVDINTAGRLSIGYNMSETPFKGAFLNIGTNYGFQLIARYNEGIAYRGYVPSSDSPTPFEEWKRILDENGGELKGALIIQNTQYSGIKNSHGKIILAAGDSNSLTGAVDDNTTIVGTIVRPTVLRTSQDNLWHYRGDKTSNYLILDTANASSHVLPLTGGTLTGDVILNSKSNNFTPSLIFQRRYADDNYVDWRIRAGADGKLEFGYNYIDDSTGIAGEWVSPITLSRTVVSINTTINSGAGFTGVMKFLNASEVSATGFAVGNAAKSTGSHSLALGYGSMSTHAGSKVIAEGGLSGSNYQTVLGYYNDEDTDSALVVGWGAGSSARKNIFTISRNGEIGFGAAGRAGILLVSPTSNQIYIDKKNDDGTNYVPFLVDTDQKSVRRGSTGYGTTLGTDQYKWFNVFTESLKIADANLTYDIGTLTVDKALKTTSTLTAPQGVFSNYVKIGNATISWNPNGYLEINEGLASHKFISAGGVVTGDAGGGGGGLSLTDMWMSLNDNIDAYGKSKIHIDHIPLDAILSHDDYETDVANRISTFNYSNSTSFTSAVKALIVADNIPTLSMSKIDGLEDTLSNIGTVVQNNYDTLNALITKNHNDHEARIKALEQALTWQTV